MHFTTLHSPFSRSLQFWTFRHNPSKTLHFSSLMITSRAMFLKIRHLQSSVASRQSPVASRQSPVASRQSPVASRQSPVASRQSPVASRQSPVSSLQSPVASRQRLCRQLVPQFDRLVDKAVFTDASSLFPDPNIAIVTFT